MNSTRPKQRTALFFNSEKYNMWDTWVYAHGSSVYLYYLTKSNGDPNGIGLAVSRDGVNWDDRGMVISMASDATWLGSGAVWPGSGLKEGMFIMNFSEWRGDKESGRQTIFFAQSADLLHWERLSSSFEFQQDTRWYDQKGRWDNIWVVQRPEGGYFGFWAATPKGGKAGLGFGQSTNGVNWVACEPVFLDNVPLGPAGAHSPEVAAVHYRGGKYYALLGLNDLEPLIDEDFSNFRPGHTTFISSSPAGPFVPAPHNRRLLVGNASYFTRFVDTPDGVLINHHSWEILEGAPLDVKNETACLAPFKRAEWDEQGTLRLKWWEGNDKAKGKNVELAPHLEDTEFDLNEILVLEGTMPLMSSPVGLYLQGTGEIGTAFLVEANGTVQYGNARQDCSFFEKRAQVDREMFFGEEAFFRLIRNGRITEFYLNDYLMQCYCLPEEGSGRIGVVGPRERFRDLIAWYSVDARDPLPDRLTPRLAMRRPIRG